MGGPGSGRVPRGVYGLALSLGLAGLLWLVLRDAQGALAAATAATPAGRDLIQLTDGPVLDGFGAWSPDGKQIAFMRDGRIWVMTASDGESRPLTRREGVWDTAPVWHPGSNQIALVRLTPGRPEGAILLVNPESGEERELIREPEPIGAVAWGPEGKYLYYTTATQLKRLDVTRRSAVAVLQLDSGWDLLAGGLAVSPDGSAVFFGAGRKEESGTRYEVWSLALDRSGATAEQVTRNGGIMPALDSAGKRLAYRNPRQQTGIHVMDLELRTTRQIVADEAGTLYFHPRFSPDGQQLLVSRLILVPPSGAESQKSFRSHLYVRRAAVPDR